MTNHALAISATAKGGREIVDELERLKTTFDLDRDNLATTVLDVCTIEIMASMDSETDPDGIPWASLSPYYLEWKAEVAPQAPMAVLHGIMKTWEQVAGARFVRADYAEMTYGVDPVAKIEAIKFTEGGIVTGTSQPPRPFYAITTAALIRVDAILGVRFDKAW